MDDDTARRLAGPLEGTPVTVGAVTLDVHIAGPADGEVVLLVAGLGMPRISWPPELIAQLHEAGYRTVTADNRDTGRSTVLPGGLAGLERTPEGTPAAVYSLTDLAGDLVGLLDHLEVTRAHVLGVSMGGMIAQRIAIDWPDRVATLHLVMTTTGDWSVGLPHEGVSWVLTTPAPDGLDGLLAHQLAAAEATGSPGLVDPTRVQAMVRAEYARGVHPAGTARQLAAILADPDRTPDLRELAVPTVVVHGAVDPLIDVSGGRAVAAAIRDSRYVEVPGMGHDLPPELLGTFLPTILEVMAAATAGGAPWPRRPTSRRW
ncbi:MAG: alpha/beta fold hydrolase [Nitriliruptoraceae bacterium]